MRPLVATMLIFAFFSVSGCLTPAYYYETKRKSAEHTGCKADDMVIMDDEGTTMGGYHSWKVECAGKKYQCTDSSKETVKCYPLPE
jgi:hypothetical protein